MDKIVEWFFEKSINGKITRSTAEALHLIGEAKIIDGVLEVGASNGLTGLILKNAIGKNFVHHIVEVSNEKINTVRQVYQKAHYSNFAVLGVGNGDKVPQLTGNYDLVIFNWPKAEELGKVYELIIKQKKTIMDAFLVFIGVDELPEDIRHAGKSQRHFPKLGLWIVRF